MGLSQADIRALLRAFDQSSWQQMAVTVGSDTIEVARRGSGVSVDGPAPPTHPQRETDPPAAEPDPPTAGTDPPAAVLVTAPSVGVFWHAPGPGAAPLVEVGGHVHPADPVGLVEVMESLNPVPAGLAGRVRAVLAADGELVEYGQPLVAVEPDAQAAR